MAARHLSRITAVSSTNVASAALNADGNVFTWGDNIWAQLGTGTVDGPDHCPTSMGEPPGPVDVCSKLPVSVVGPSGRGTLSGVVAIAALNDDDLALRSDGTVWTWGINVSGQLGIGTHSGPQECKLYSHFAAVGCSAKPVEVAGPGGKGVLNHVVAVAGGADFDVALRADGTVWAWGSDAFADLGSGLALARAVLQPVRRRFSIPIKPDHAAMTRLFADLSKSAEWPRDYARSILEIEPIVPDLWLPANPSDGQNANLYDREWREIIDANIRFIEFNPSLCADKDIMNDARHRSVLVVGGGVSGLTSAPCLRRRGYDVTVVAEHLRLGSLRSSPEPCGSGPPSVSDIIKIGFARPIQTMVDDLSRHLRRPCLRPGNRRLYATRHFLLETSG